MAESLTPWLANGADAAWNEPASRQRFANTFGLQLLISGCSKDRASGSMGILWPDFHVIIYTVCGSSLLQEPNGGFSECCFEISEG